MHHTYKYENILMHYISCTNIILPVSIPHYYYWQQLPTSAQILSPNPSPPIGELTSYVLYFGGLGHTWHTVVSPGSALMNPSYQALGTIWECQGSKLGPS